MFNNIAAQSDFRAGYIITLKMDTIQGFIDNRNYQENCQLCCFKFLHSDSVFTYGPQQIYGYRFKDGKYYVSREIEIENSKRNVFLEYLINGKLNIYFYRDVEGDDHYFAEKDTIPLKELKYSKALKYVDGIDHQVIYETNIHRLLLIYYTQDCPQIRDEILSLKKPEFKNLISIAKNYHNNICKDKPCIIYHKTIPLNIKLEVLYGALYKDVDEEVFLRSLTGIKLHFMYSQISERIYFTTGLVINKCFDNTSLSKPLYRIPLNLDYISSRNGFSPLFGGGINILNIDGIWWTAILSAGVQYKSGLLTYKLYPNADFFFPTTEYFSSKPESEKIYLRLNFGISVDIFNRN